MRKFLFSSVVVLIVAMMFWLVGCAKDEASSTSPSTSQNDGKTNPNSPTPSGGNGGGNPGGGRNGTTLLDQYVTVDCFNYYDWTFTKVMDPGPYILCKDAFQEVSAEICATKGAQHIGFSGTVYEKNGPDVATEGLKVTVTLLENCGGGTGYVAVAGPFDITASGPSSLDPGADGTWNYSIDYAFNPSCSYKVSANITITNHSGHIGVPFGPSPDGDGSPCVPTNDCVTVNDVLGTIVPANPLAAVDGWSITASPSSLDFCASGCQKVTVRIQNNTAPNEESFTSTNTVVLGNEVVASAGFGFSTVGCTPPDLGCSYTQGFWKTHGCVGPHGSDQYGNNPDLITPLLEAGGPITMGNRVISTCEQAGAVFQDAEGNQGNAIKRLYSQMLASLLSIENGADGSCISDALAAANAVLSEADPTGTSSGWAGISGANRSAVQSAASTFDQYNNGLLCVPHCE